MINIIVVQLSAFGKAELLKVSSNHGVHMSDILKGFEINLKRRDFLNLSLMPFAMSLIGCRSIVDLGAKHKFANFSGDIADLENKSGGRIGVFAMDIKNGNQFGYRMNERFALCSTFKLPLASFILHDICKGKISRDENISIKANGLKPFTQSVENALKYGEMNVLEAAKAAQIYSDNITANALLDKIGGPQGFTARLRQIGDTVTRLDDIEPKLNIVKLGEANNTTTPRAIAKTVSLLLSQEYLGEEYYKLLSSWMRETKTGMQRIRGGLPQNWASGDKTGTAIFVDNPNYYNDISVVFDNETNKYIISVYYISDKYYDKIRPEDEDVIKQAALITSRYLQQISN